MLDTRETRQLKAGMLKIWIVWLAMYGSLFLYLIIAFFLGQEKTPYDLSAVEQITFILYGVAFVGLVGAYFIRKKMLQKASTTSVSEIPQEASIHYSPYIDKYMPAVVVSLAISETIGVLGLTIFFLGRDLTTLLVFLAISASGIFFYRPKFEELEQLAIAIKQNSAL